MVRAPLHRTAAAADAAHARRVPAPRPAPGRVADPHRRPGPGRVHRHGRRLDRSRGRRAARLGGWDRLGQSRFRADPGADGRPAGPCDGGRRARRGGRASGRRRHPVGAGRPAARNAARIAGRHPRAAAPAGRPWLRPPARGRHGCRTWSATCRRCRSGWTGCPPIRTGTGPGPPRSRRSTAGCGPPSRRCPSTGATMPTSGNWRRCWTSGGSRCSRSRCGLPSRPPRSVSSGRWPASADHGSRPDKRP